MVWEVIVIGGGAAGFFAAITYAEAGGTDVLILEKTKHVLGKVKISGGGRCNVTHDCFEPKALTQNYPRGMKELIGNFHRFGAEETVEWFASHGVELKTEADGRMFPTTDSSETIISCLEGAASQAGVEVRRQCGVATITKEGDIFELQTDTGETLRARRVLLATGGSRLAAGARLASSLGHDLSSAVPSLFTFQIDDDRLKGLSGLSVRLAQLSIGGSGLKDAGPLLITHWGLSGPAVLKLSAWGARELFDIGYNFELVVDWAPTWDAQTAIAGARRETGKRLVIRRSLCPDIPKRLWERICHTAGIADDVTFAQLGKDQATQLITQIKGARFQVAGKSLNKDEFVTCGGVELSDISLKTMESRICPGLYFAGEVMNVDGVTGGFNFQNAWTSGHHAGIAMLPWA